MTGLCSCALTGSPILRLNRGTALENYPVVALSLIAKQQDPLVVPTVLNAVTLLPKQIPIQLVLQDENLQPHLEEKFGALIDESRIIITILKPTNDVPSKIVRSRNKLLTSPFFWNHVKGEIVSSLLRLHRLVHVYYINTNTYRHVPVYYIYCTCMCKCICMCI
jgi:hypothetical protein